MLSLNVDLYCSLLGRLAPQEVLVECEQHLVDLIDVVVATADEKLNDNIKLVAVGEDKARFHKHFPRLAERQLKGNRKSQGRGLRWFIELVAPYL